MTEAMELREEIARAILEAHLVDQYGSVDPDAADNEWFDWLAEADALLPIITRERERAARDGLIASQKAAIGYRDHADKWHLDRENNPSGSGYCCLKTAANIVGAIGDISPSDIVKGMK